VSDSLSLWVTLSRNQSLSYLLSLVYTLTLTHASALSQTLILSLSRLHRNMFSATHALSLVFTLTWTHASSLSHPLTLSHPLSHSQKSFICHSLSLSRHTLTLPHLYPTLPHHTKARHTRDLNCRGAVGSHIRSHIHRNIFSVTLSHSPVFPLPLSRTTLKRATLMISTAAVRLAPKFTLNRTHIQSHVHRNIFSIHTLSLSHIHSPALHYSAPHS